MSPELIKVKLAERGYTVGMLASVLERSPGLVSKVINRKLTSMIVVRAIAQALALPVAEVFPEIKPEFLGRSYIHTNDYKTKRDELKQLLADI